MRIIEEVKLDFKDVLFVPKRSTLTSRREVDLIRHFEFKHSKYKYSGVPIMASNMDGVGTFEVALELSKHNVFTCLVKTYGSHEITDFFDNNEVTEHVAMSIGITEQDREKLHDVYHCIGRKLKYVCVDVANGYSERFAKFIKNLRQHYPFLVIIAGNVVTREMTEELILAGADIVKVGIGPGSVCTTRIQTGVGYPQLSAVIECADAAHGLGGHIIADGGCTYPGDVAKAFAAGADFVMLGGMLAGHDEGGGEVITKRYKTDELERNPISATKWQRRIEEKKFVQFYGMSSESANEKHFGGLKDYRSSEGRTVLVPYKGPVAKTVQDILGGVRSTCTYAGAKTIKQLPKCATFIRCTQTHNSVYEKSTIGN